MILPQALEDITNISTTKSDETKKLSLEKDEEKKRIRNTLPSTYTSTISEPCENVELMNFPTSTGKRREDKKNKTLRTNEKFDDINSNIDEILREDLPEDSTKSSALSPHYSSSSSSSQPETLTETTFELLGRLIALDKDEILRKVSGVRVIEYIPRSERIRYKKLAAAEYVKKVKEIVDNDIVNSERYMSIIIEAERLGYHEMSELLRKIKEEEENNCLMDPLFFIKRLFCGLTAPTTAPT